MSTLYVLGVDPGNCEQPIEWGIDEFHNSWGFGPEIWDGVWNKYFTDAEFPNIGWSARLGVMIDRDDIFQRVPIEHLAVLFMTFDDAYVAKEDFERAADDIRHFTSSGIGQGHLPAIEQIFRRPDPEWKAIGFQITQNEVAFKGKWNQETQKCDFFSWDERSVNVYEHLESSRVNNKID